MKLTRILIVVTTITFFKLLTSCIFNCKCPEPVIENIDINCVSVKPIINNEIYISGFPSKKDTVNAKAVAFLLEFSDTVYTNLYSETSKNIAISPLFTGYKGAMAFSCNCNEVDFAPIKKIKDISVKTIFDINGEYRANSDISQLFVGKYDESAVYLNYLYCSLDEIINYHRNIVVYDNYNFSFSIYLKEEVKTDSLKFEISIAFADNSTLSETTPTLYIKH